MVAAAAVVLALAGCKRGEQVAPLNTIYATVASHNGVNPSGGKSHIDGNSVCWSKNDTIALITTGDEKIAGEKIAYTLSGDGGTTTGTFTGVEPQTKTGPYCVVYPYSSVTSSSFSNGVFTVEYSLPRVQSYSKNSFGEGANLSIGYSNDYNFKFLNMLGVLKVTIKNKASCLVKKVELVSRNTSDVLWGDGTVTINGSTADDLSFGTQLTGGNHILTLGNYMKWDAGDVSLYFVVPAGTLQDGFEIKIYEEGYVNPITDANDEAIEFTNPTGLNVIQRNMVSELDFGDGRVIQTTGYVDLGIAGRWAPCNWGADKPYEPGWYCQFGGKVDVKGKDRRQLREECPYFYVGGRWMDNPPKYWAKFKKYTSKKDNYSETGVADGLSELTKEDRRLDSDWRIPSKDEVVDTLYNRCDCSWLPEKNDEYGKAGCKLTAPNGNYIFLPACGYWGHIVENYNNTTPSLLEDACVFVGSGTITYIAYSFRAMRVRLVNGNLEMDIDDEDDPSTSTKYWRYFGVPFRPIYDGK